MKYEKLKQYTFQDYQSYHRGIEIDLGVAKSRPACSINRTTVELKYIIVIQIINKLPYQSYHRGIEIDSYLLF